MNATASSLIHRLARNYRLCQADFPTQLKPKHLDVPAGQQATVFAGLSILRAVLGDIYDHFADLAPTGNRGNRFGISPE